MSSRPSRCRNKLAPALAPKMRFLPPAPFGQGTESVCRMPRGESQSNTDNGASMPRLPQPTSKSEPHCGAMLELSQEPSEPRAWGNSNSLELHQVPSAAFQSTTHLSRLPSDSGRGARGKRSPAMLELSHHSSGTVRGKREVSVVSQGQGHPLPEGDRLHRLSRIPLNSSGGKVK